MMNVIIKFSSVQYFSAMMQLKVFSFVKMLLVVESTHGL